MTEAEQFPSKLTILTLDDDHVNYLSMGFLPHHGMARPRVADRRDDLQM
jgi:hypothetical protein